MKGWHKDRARHSAASKKGWRRRRQGGAKRLKMARKATLVSVEAGSREELIRALMKEFSISKAAATAMAQDFVARKPFERGSVERALRDVRARQLAKHPQIKEPFAVATKQIQQAGPGKFKLKDGKKVKHDLAEEIRTQFAAAKSPVYLTRRQAHGIARQYVERRPA